MVENLYKGWQGTVLKGPSGSEETVGKIVNASVLISNNPEAHYAAGSRNPNTIKEGNQLVSGEISKFFIDGAFIAQTLGSSSIINFVGINNGSATHIYSSKQDTDGNTKLAPSSWSGTELSSANYDKIEADDANTFANTAAGVGDFAAHLIKFDNPGTEANIDLMQVEFVGFGTGDTNGFEIFVYDFDNTEWVSLGTSDASSAMGSVVGTLEDTGQFQEVSTGDIYFMVRNRVAKTTLDNVLTADYVELRVFNTTKTAVQEDVSLQLKLDATTDITLTVNNAKFDNWSMSFDDSGTLVVENITYTGKTLSKNQT